MSVTDNLNPKKVFYYFEEICKIPHGSGNIDRLSDYLVNFAKERDLFYIQDTCKNVIIIKEAAPGYEDAEPVILQGHMDMVAVKKPGALIDMEKEGLRLAIDGDDLLAEDTSLGGDDGIAVAYALAILDSNEIAHPRLEVIVTVDEEVGMDGARELDVSMLQGRRMLNLDSEEEGFILAGCAGGARVDWTLPVAREEREGKRFAVRLEGLQGGHSGAEIDKERGNANSLLGRLLYSLGQSMDFYLEELEGGLADNAIPREARAVIVIGEEKEKLLMDGVKAVEEELRQELQTKDPDIRIEVEKLEKTEKLEETEEKRISCVTGEDTMKVVSLLFAAPCGVQAMSADMKGLVETSLNLGIISLKENKAAMQFSVRSSLESAKGALIAKLKSIASIAGASQEVRGDYPGWAYRKNSPFRDMAVKVFYDLYGKEPEIQAIHAGLECGLFSAKIPGLECISIGPDMKNIHTTEERLSISSTERVWNYVVALLKAAKKGQ